MKFDNIDIDIIFFLFDNNNSTTSDIAKKIFKLNNSRGLAQKDSLVRERLKRMSEQKIVKFASENPKLYSVNSECVFTGQGTFRLNVNGDKSIELDFGLFLVITDGRDYVQIHKIKEPSADIEIMT